MPGQPRFFSGSACTDSAQATRPASGLRTPSSISRTAAPSGADVRCSMESISATAVLAMSSRDGGDPRPRRALVRRGGEVDRVHVAARPVEHHADERRITRGGERLLHPLGERAVVVAADELVRVPADVMRRVVRQHRQRPVVARRGGRRRPSARRRPDRPARATGRGVRRGSSAPCPRCRRTGSVACCVGRGASSDG